MNDFNRNVLNELTDELNNSFKPYNIEFFINTKHIVERMHERNIRLGDLRYALLRMNYRHKCLFLYYSKLDEHIRPFKINIVTKDVIVCLGASYRGDKIFWRVSTVLDPNHHNKGGSQDGNFGVDIILK